MKKTLIIIGLAFAFSASAQTNVIDLSPLQTNNVKVVLTSNQWDMLRFDLKAYKAISGDTNMTFNLFTDLTASKAMSNHVMRVKANKINALRALMAREPSEAKIDAALEALK